MRRGILGLGSYGCVISPALVFPESVFITEGNCVNYVTKLAENANDEYDVAKQIELLCPSVGVFPVDSLVCNIPYGLLREFYTSFKQKCGKIKSLRDFIQNIDMQRSAYVKGLTEYRPTFRGGKQICAIQYLRYDYDARQFIKILKQRPLKKARKLSVSVYNNFVTKLHEMHSKNVVHMDIKLDNMCIVNNEGFFADWGLSQVIDSPEQVKICAKKLLYTIREETGRENVVFYNYYVSNSPIAKFGQVTFEQALYTQFSVLLKAYKDNLVSQTPTLLALLKATIFEIEKIVLYGQLLFLNI